MAQIGELRPSGKQEVVGVGIGSSEITAIYEGVTSDPVMIDIQGKFIRLSIESVIGAFVLSPSDPPEEYLCIQEYTDENDNLRSLDVTDISQWTSTNIDMAEIGENIAGIQRVYGISLGESVITCFYDDAGASKLLIIIE